jgi:hypothetical protein
MYQFSHKHQYTFVPYTKQVSVPLARQTHERYPIRILARELVLL